MRNFYNQKATIVSEAIDGLVAASGGRIVRFDPASHARVVLRADWDKSKVAIVSGGGSGHEPSHAGLVGKGMLTAAVCGDIFASPSVDAVLAAIVAVTGPSGCLLVVKNYTGDRLNFGLAAEKAKALGLKVEMMIVADDIAIPDAPRPRGLAGTVFVHKIAGTMSEGGRTLEDIAAAAEALVKGIHTIGVARDTCTIPGSPKPDRIGPDEVEVGLGIHGEPGVEIAKPSTSADLVANLAHRITPYIKADVGYALLFNNLGGLSGLECAVLLSDVMRSAIAVTVKYVGGPANVMTALDMPGFSLSLLELTPEIEGMLLAPTACSAWPAFEKVVASSTIAAPELDHETRLEPSSNIATRQVVENVIATCLSMQAEIDALDAKVGDGDTGSTFASAAMAVQSSLDLLPFAEGDGLLSSLSDIVRKVMGGSSGVLFAILLARSSESYRDVANWGLALASGLEAMQKYGGAALGDRTMVDALKPALEALNSGAGMNVAAAAARAGANATASMLKAKAGRSSYLEARSLEGINDPGAEAVARIFEALARDLAQA